MEVKFAFFLSQHEVRFLYDMHISPLKYKWKQGKQII